MPRIVSARVPYRLLFLLLGGLVAAYVIWSHEEVPPSVQEIHRMQMYVSTAFEILNEKNEAPGFPEIVSRRLSSLPSDYVRAKHRERYAMWGRRDQGQTLVLAYAGNNGAWDGQGDEGVVAEAVLERASEQVIDILRNCIDQNGSIRSYPSGGFGSVQQIDDDIYIYIDVGIIEHLLLYYHLMDDESGSPELREACEQKLHALHDIANATGSHAKGWSPLAELRTYTLVEQPNS